MTTIRRLVNKHAHSTEGIRALGAALADVYEVDLTTHRLVAVPKCETCKGEGDVPEQGGAPFTIECPDCHGTGDAGCIYDVVRYYDTATKTWGYERRCVADGHEHGTGVQP